MAYGNLPITIFPSKGWQWHPWGGQNPPSNPPNQGSSGVPSRPLPPTPTIASGTGGYSMTESLIEFAQELKMLEKIICTISDEEYALLLLRFSGNSEIIKLLTRIKSDNID